MNHISCVSVSPSTALYCSISSGHPKLQHFSSQTTPAYELSSRGILPSSTARYKPHEQGVLYNQKTGKYEDSAIVFYDTFLTPFFSQVKVNLHQAWQSIWSPFRWEAQNKHLQQKQQATEELQENSTSIDEKTTAAFLDTIPKAAEPNVSDIISIKPATVPETKKQTLQLVIHPQMHGGGFNNELQGCQAVVKAMELKSDSFSLPPRAYIDLKTKTDLGGSNLENLEIIIRQDESNNKVSDGLPASVTSTILNLIKNGASKPSYDCLLFINDCIENSSQKWVGKIPVNLSNLENELKTGDYIWIHNDRDVQVHAALYLSDGLFLSVGGTLSPLIVTTYQGMFQLFEGKSIAKIVLAPVHKQVPDILAPNHLQYVLEEFDQPPFNDDNSLKIYTHKIRYSNENWEGVGGIPNLGTKKARRVDFWLKTHNGYTNLSQALARYQDAFLSIFFNPDKEVINKNLLYNSSITGLPTQAKMFIIEDFVKYQEVGDLILFKNRSKMHLKEAEGFAISIGDGLAIGLNYKNGKASLVTLSIEGFRKFYSADLALTPHRSF